MSDYRTDRPYWCESCARQKDCYGITLRPKCFVPIADRKTEPTTEDCSTVPTSSKMEQVEDEPLTCSFSDCDNFKNPDYARCIECKRKQIELKTEPTISKMEQVDKDINVRSKDEPQSDDVFDYCPRCGMRILSKWAKDEPQTDVYEYNNGEWVKPDCPWK